MFPKIVSIDARYFQILFQLIFLSYGIIFLGWSEWTHYAICIVGCIVINYVAESARQGKLIALGQWRGWALSVLISALSLCLLLKTNHWYTSVLAAGLTVLSKYLLRLKGKHIFNPSAFGIVITLLISNDAWLSPGQWGNGAILFFSVITLGTIVVTRVQKLDISLAFLFTYAGLLFWRQVFVLGWPMDYFFHSISGGSLLLFTFFMISDPKTSPAHPLARVIFAVLIAAAAFYLSAFKWMYNTPILVLVAAGPIVALFDKFFRAKVFEWKASAFRNSGLHH